jgi:cytochrome c peroxidase
MPRFEPRLRRPLVFTAAAALLATTLGFVTASEDADRFRASYVRPDSIPFPADNELTTERWTLGRRLFFDSNLSGANDLSCASCHNPSRSWGDGQARAIGTGNKVLGRRTPTVLNTAWAAALFWDGRAGSLEEQSLGPIASPGEMNMPLTGLLVRLNANPSYRAEFARAYGTDSITSNDVARAIATFERTVVSNRAPFDRWVAGDANAISASAKRGFVAFNTKANCAACHSGWRFTDDSFHDIGVASSDSGREGPSRH